MISTATSVQDPGEPSASRACTSGSNKEACSTGITHTDPDGRFQLPRAGARLVEHHRLLTTPILEPLGWSNPVGRVRQRGTQFELLLPAGDQADAHAYPDLRPTAYRDLHPDLYPDSHTHTPCPASASSPASSSSTRTAIRCRSPASLGCRSVTLAARKTGAPLQQITTDAQRLLHLPRPRPRHVDHRASRYPRAWRSSIRQTRWGLSIQPNTQIGLVVRTRLPAHGHADEHSYAHSNAHRHRNGNGNPDGYGDAHTHADQYCNGHRDGHGDENPHADSRAKHVRIEAP